MFQRAGYADYLVRGLTERARYLTVRGRPDDYPRAFEDLETAQVEAERGRMDLLLADVLLVRAAGQFGAWRSTVNVVVRRSLAGDFAQSLGQAEGLVDSLGYGRRQDALRQLRLRADLDGLTTADDF